MDAIFTHNNADFDAAAALLGAYKLYPEYVPVLPARMNRNVSEFVTLYKNGLPFVFWEDVHDAGIKRVILVDTQQLPEQTGSEFNGPVMIIDHHRIRRDFGSHEQFTGEELGATTTLLVERMQQQHLSLTSLEATLLALGIYEDTGSLTYGTTTPRDIMAAAWLLSQGAALDTIRRFLSHPLTGEQQALLDKLLAAADHRVIQGHMIVVSGVQMDSYIEQINSVAHRLMDLLDPAALVVVVQMPSGLQLVLRSNGQAVDVSEIARHFGGGGHSRAAAASVSAGTLDAALAKLWALLFTHVQPMTRVGDLMSYGVQTVNADDAVGDVIHHLRRIGHEGYPVVENGRLVGLLTKRDADKALEHGLKRARVRDVMMAGSVTLTPDDAVSVLEERMVESGWGQIPVVGQAGSLVGIVTRTDLIKHWARIHPARVEPHMRVEAETIQRVLGADVFRLIELVAQQAQARSISIYLVGGVVRDLLLERRNLDIDFVVEGSAIEFAESLKAAYGGEVSSFRPFGTAKWRLNETIADRLDTTPTNLPDHIDFATSRNEFYEHPTALPTVYNSSIKLDLMRRDFTINTLSIQLSPAAVMGRVLDFYGGMHDLKSGLIRVLHSLSFIDDPTRILRAIRFEQRLGFKIEPRTAELIDTALPMLQRITGERLQNELALLLNEAEPELGLSQLRDRGILRAIHPSFEIGHNIGIVLKKARETRARWPAAVDSMAALYWHLMLIDLPEQRVRAVCERLLIGRSLTDSIAAAARLAGQPGDLASPVMYPSTVVARLEKIPETALTAVWIQTEQAQVKERIERFLTEWRHIRPVTDGNRLKARGLKPGPSFRIILERLRTARLDGEITTGDEEQQLLERLIKEAGYDGN